MRHWIVGTGKSLLKTPLELLKDEISWSLNRIHLYYPNTSWRPNYYLMVDFNSQNPKDYWKECIKAHWDIPKFLWDGFRNGDKGYVDLGEGIGEVPNTTWIPRCKKHHYYMGDNVVKRAQSWHLPEICTAFSGLGSVIQLAVMNGATEICLLGCDLYVPDYRQNFFTENYTGDFRERHVPDNQNMTWMHQLAKQSSPVPIYNCTVGGNLEIYKRRNMEEVLNG